MEADTINHKPANNQRVKENVIYLPEETHVYKEKKPLVGCHGIIHKGKLGDLTDTRSKTTTKATNC